MIITLKDKMVGKFCSVELTTDTERKSFEVRGYYGDCIGYNFEVFHSYDEAEKFYNSLNTVKKCKAFYAM